MRVIVIKEGKDIFATAVVNEDAVTLASLKRLKSAALANGQIAYVNYPDFTDIGELIEDLESYKE